MTSKSSLEEEGYIFTSLRGSMSPRHLHHQIQNKASQVVKGIAVPLCAAPICRDAWCLRFWVVFVFGSLIRNTLTWQDWGVGKMTPKSRTKEEDIPISNRSEPWTLNKGQWGTSQVALEKRKSWAVFTFALSNANWQTITHFGGNVQGCFEPHCFLLLFFSLIFF